jgi:hypothetical protein
MGDPDVRNERRRPPMRDTYYERGHPLTVAVLLERYPASLSQPEMAEATGYSPDASTIGAGMSRLRGIGLAEGWSAAADFVEAIHG